MPLEPNTEISHYKILSSIGKGGMGEVYLALDTKLNRKVAIKFLSEEFSRDTDKLNRFIQEAQAASALNHPNIVTIHEIGEADDSRYIALEYVDGETLTSFLKGSHKFGATLDIATQIASALDAAHSAGIVHRDIKPDNVMIRKDGLVKILDFGIAKLTEANSPEIESEDKTAVQVNTTPGMIIGTASYMSPEQAAGKEVDARTDIFSFGVVLYEMMSGRLPFEGGTAMESISSILKDEPKPLNDPEVPSDLRKMIGKCLRKDPDERYQTMKGLLADLKETKQELEFQEKLDRTIQPEREQSETQVFQATTASDTQPTTASGTTNDSITIKRSSIGKVLAGVASIVILAAIGTGYWYFSSGNKINSIAVMPFVNESGSADVEYLSDGMTETLIASLTEIPNLSVKARSTVFFYKGKEKSVKELGEELNVESVLLGRVTQRGEDLKVTLELVDAKTLDALWAGTYNRKMSDLVSLQSEIARDVSDKLRLELTAAVQEKVTKSDTANSKARQLYLKGIYHLNKRAGQNGGQELAKSAELFKQAIEQDPDYAIAYTGLADSYTLMPFWGAYRSTEYLPKAKEAALKALELNKDLAQGYASLGNILLFEYDWDGAEREYKRAIELDPKYANVYKWYGDLLASKEMYDESLQEYEKALELDPFNLSTLDAKANAFVAANRLDEAVSQCKKIIELFPEQGRTNFLLSRIFATKGMEQEAWEQRRMGMEKFGVPEARIRSLENVYREEGYQGLIRADLERRSAFMKSRLEEDKNAVIKYMPSARDYAYLKNKEKALEYLMKAFEDRDPELTDIKRTRVFDFLRDDPEYQALLRKIGFPN